MFYLFFIWRFEKANFFNKSLPRTDPSENYDFEGEYETKSDDVENKDEVDDERANNVNTQNSGTNTMNPALSTIVNLNRLNIMRLAFRNAMMLMLG